MITDVDYLNTEREMFYTIVNFEAKAIPKRMFSNEVFPAGVAALADQFGNTYWLSRFEDEENWTIDAHLMGNGFPIFVNGEGIRQFSSKILDSRLPAIAELNAYFNSVFKA
jgi:hypothetical protein